MALKPDGGDEKRVLQWIAFYGITVEEAARSARHGGRRSVAKSARDTRLESWSAWLHDREYLWADMRLFVEEDRELLAEVLADAGARVPSRSLEGSAHRRLGDEASVRDIAGMLRVQLERLCVDDLEGRVFDSLAWLLAEWANASDDGDAPWIAGDTTVGVFLDELACALDAAAQRGRR